MDFWDLWKRASYANKGPKPLLLCNVEYFVQQIRDAVGSVQRRSRSRDGAEKTNKVYYAAIENVFELCNELELCLEDITNDVLKISQGTVVLVWYGGGENRCAHSRHMLHCRENCSDGFSALTLHYSV